MIIIIIISDCVLPFRQEIRVPKPAGGDAQIGIEPEIYYAYVRVGTYIRVVPLIKHASSLAR